MKNKNIQYPSNYKGRRDFIKSVSAGAIGLAGTGIILPKTEANQKRTKARTRDEKIKSMASNSYAVNALF